MGTEGQPRQRKKRNSKSENTSGPDENKNKQAVHSNGVSKAPSKCINFQIKPADSIQTDFRCVYHHLTVHEKISSISKDYGLYFLPFSSEEPLQRVVRISRNGEIMVTGGTDGFIRVWQFPSMNRVHNIKAHSKEIDDLDICHDSATVSKVFIEIHV